MRKVHQTNLKYVRKPSYIKGYLEIDPVTLKWIYVVFWIHAFARALCDKEFRDYWGNKAQYRGDRD